MYFFPILRQTRSRLHVVLCDLVQPEVDPGAGAGVDVHLHLAGEAVQGAALRAQAGQVAHVGARALLAGGLKSPGHVFDNKRNMRECWL